MNREEYLIRRNSKKGIASDVLYAYYRQLCEDQGKAFVPYEVFLEHGVNTPRITELAIEALDYYDEAYDILRVFTVKNGKQLLVKCM